MEQRAFKKVESEKDLLSFEGNGSTSDNSLRLVPIKGNSPPPPSLSFFIEVFLSLYDSGVGRAREN